MRASPRIWGHLHRTGRANAIVALAVTAVRRAARDAGEESPGGPIMRQAREGFRRGAGAAAPSAAAKPAASPPRSAPPCGATCLRPRRTGSGVERGETAGRRVLSTPRSWRCSSTGALRRSQVAVFCVSDVEFADGGDVMVTVQVSKTNADGQRPAIRRRVGGCAPPTAACRQLPRRNLAIRSSVSAPTR